MIISRKGIIPACPQIRMNVNYASLSAVTIAKRLRTAKSLQCGRMGIKRRILQTVGRDCVWKFLGVAGSGSYAITDEYICDAMTRVCWEYDMINLQYPFTITHT